MKYIIFIATFVLTTQWAVAGTLKPLTIEDALNLINTPSPAISTSLNKLPINYEFTNETGQSTVHYSGQTLRQILMNDYKLVASRFKRGEKSGNADLAKNEINQLFRHTKTFALLPFRVKAVNEKMQSMIIAEGIDYGSIDDSGKDLKGKMAGDDNDLRKASLLGWNSQIMEGVSLELNSEGNLLPTALVDQMIQVISNNAASGKSFKVSNGNLVPQEIVEAHILETGVDLAQLSQKLISVGMAFSQATGDYLSIDLGDDKGLNADNTIEDVKLGYTSLQHHWDEAFGYFGAARNFFDYTDTQIKAGMTLDRYVATPVFSGSDFLYWDHGWGTDGMAALGAEKNFGFAINAGKRDVGANDSSIDFTDEIFDAFLKGRHLIQDKPQNYLVYAQAYAVVAAHQWERLVAANTIHYINELLSDLKNYGTQDFRFTDMAKHFGEMKGFALGFQFNPNSVMSTGQFQDLHLWLGDQPADPTQDTTAYQGRLILARDLLEKIYDFNHSVVVGW